MYQDGGTTLIDAAKSYEPKAMIYAEGVRRSSELANAINITSRLFSEGTNPKDVAKMLFATASLESDFGTTTQKNHFQIDPPAYNRVFGKNDKGNYTSKQKEYFSKIEALTGLQAKDITHDQVKNNPLLSAITARLYYTKSPNAIPTNAQDFANEYLGHYNAGGAQKYQSEEYTKKKAQERFMQASMAIDKMFEDNPGPVANPQERKVTGPTGDTVEFAEGGIPVPPPPPPPLDPANFGEPGLEDLNTELLDTTGVDSEGIGTGDTATATTATEVGVGLEEAETSEATVTGSSTTDTEADVIDILQEDDLIDTAVDVNITDNLDDYIDYLDDIDIDPPNDDDDDDDDDDDNNLGEGTEYVDPNLEPTEVVVESVGPSNPVATDPIGNPVLREPQTYVDPSTVQSGLGTQGVSGVYGGAGGGTGTIKGIQRGRRGMGSFGGGFFARQEDEDKVNIFQAAGDIYSSLLRREIKKNKR